MPTTILQATIGAGKTEAALQRLAQTLRTAAEPFPKAWVLLATKRQEVAFRERLALLNADQPIYFNVEFFEFYELNSRLLNLAAQPARRMKEPARLGLLRRILADLHAEDALRVFAPIATTSGFVQAVGNLIYELKQNLVYPEKFVEVAQNGTPKDRELAYIYQRYQDVLREHNLVDREGEGWLALSALQRQDRLGRDVALLLVDGYDQFTLSQARLLALLSQRISDVAITLTTVPGREATIGRRFARAQARLEAEHAGEGAALRTLQLDDLTNRPEELRLLSANIQQPTERIEPQHDPTRVQLIEAPEPAQEVAAVLRRIRALLLNGVRPDDMLVALRDWGNYHTHFLAYGRAYGLPLLLHYAQDVAQNPAVVTLLDVLRLSDNDFRRRAVLDVLRSPYVQAAGLTDDATLDLLERVSREKQVVSGRTNWLQALEDAAEPTYDEDGEEQPPILTYEQYSALQTALETFFEQVTPPPRAPLEHYVGWIDRLMGDDPLQNPDEQDDEGPETVHPQMPYTLNLLACIRALAEAKLPDAVDAAALGAGAIVNRDLAAVDALKDMLRGFLATQQLLRATLGDEGHLRWERFLGDLLANLTLHQPPQRNPARNGRILVTTTADARGLPHPHVFILGLAEGVFPAPVSEDVLYLDRERQALKDAEIMLLTQDERADDEGIFYELISLARETLTLSRPTVREGKPWNESHLWRLVEAVFTHLTCERYGIGEPLAPSQVATLDEALLAALSPEAAGLRAWLLADVQRSAAWARVQHGLHTEAGRMGKAPHDAYSGRLQAADNLARAAEAFGPGRVWSATRLNDYGACGYRFFAKHLLRLDALEEPEAGLDVLRLGSINHKILEKTYDEVRSLNLSITPDNAQEAQDILRVMADEVFEDAPEVYQFRPDALWQQRQSVMLRDLRDLVALDFSDASPLNKFGKPRYVHALEEAFGLDGVYPVTIPMPDVLDTIRVRGKIDRVDRAGDHLIVIDYKSGSGNYPKDDLLLGRNVQMLIYVLAYHALLRQRGDHHLTIRAGLFWAIRRSQNPSVHFEFDAHEDSTVLNDTDGILAQAQAQVAMNLQRGAAGDFSVQPAKPASNGRCTSYCEFYQLCRVLNTSRYKRDALNANNF